jgi:hypothetical protein
LKPNPQPEIQGEENEAVLRKHATEEEPSVGQEDTEQEAMDIEESGKTEGTEH